MEQNERLKLTNIHLEGFKSVNGEGQDIPLGDITVLLGANGAGKSNLISFFKMLNYMMTGALQIYIGESGFADSLLYYGSKRTPRLRASLTFSNADSEDTYHFALSHAAGDTLIFTEESFVWQKRDSDTPYVVQLDPGSKESRLTEKGESDKTAAVISSLLKGCRVFQFHDTSKEAKIRNSGYIEDDSFLRSDGGNLAAFLYAMQQQEETRPYYQRIVRYVRMAMPQFHDFVLQPSPRNENYIILNWRESDSEYLFGLHQISDGSLRFMALATLLLQPLKTLPEVIVLDEPELGLHPAAIPILAGMIRTASQHSRVLLATQSTRLVDEFDPENIVVVERDEKEECSVYRRLDAAALAQWLERYSLSELWEKNVIGGRP